jgi:alpha-beta hydrolase superfamily lysophospholipase
MEDKSFVDAHGVEVFTYWWTVPEPRGNVLISHGASEHGARYDRFAQALNAAGFSAFAIDHRGHGHTAKSTGPGKMGAGGGNAVVDDLHALRAQVDNGAPTFLFGHSMGSIFALAYLTQHSDGLAGGILCGFPSDPNGGAAMRDLMKGLVESGMGDESFDGLRNTNTNEDARTPYDWLSRDDAEVDKYIADPMCGDDNPLTYGYIADFIDLVVDAADRLDAVHCPTLVIAGDQDPTGAMGVHPAALAEGLKAAGVATDLTLYPGARHELLNETNRDEVTADIVTWLGAHLG